MSPNLIRRIALSATYDRSMGVRVGHLQGSCASDFSYRAQLSTCQVSWSECRLCQNTLYQALRAFLSHTDAVMQALQSVFQRQLCALFPLSYAILTFLLQVFTTQRPLGLVVPSWRELSSFLLRASVVASNLSLATQPAQPLGPLINCLRTTHSTRPVYQKPP